MSEWQPGDEQPDTASMLRVNQAGEYGAARIYAGQLAILGRQVNRKRAQRVMREQRLLQRHLPLRRRRRPGFFRVERPDQLWHLDMTSIWVAEHGWTYLNAAIDCCTREIVGWSLELRCRSEEAIELVDAAVAARGIEPGSLTLGTDNGSAFTSRRFRQQLAAHGVTHRRGGYRDPESQAFIESWFGKLKERLADHQFEAAMGLRQPWGTANASFELSHFLNRSGAYRVSAFGGTDVRLFKGFSISIDGGISRRRDQLSLRKGEASTEEILIRQRELATDYSYEFSFGLSYSFGSIFNSVVNPRFGRAGGF